VSGWARQVRGVSGARKRGLGALAALLLALPTPARAEQLVFSTYLPGIPVKPDERSRLVNEIASKLSSVLGVPVKGRTYGALVDFERAIGEADFVLVESPVLLSLPALRPLATAVIGGSTELQPVLLGSAVQRARLADRRIVHPRYGKATQAFIDSVLFDGDPAGRALHRLPVPDALSGVSMHKLGKTEYLIGYLELFERLRAASPELQILLRGMRIPGLVLAQGGSARGAAHASRVAAVLAGVAFAPLGITGFRPTGDVELLRRAMAAGRRMPILPILPLPLPDRATASSPVKLPTAAPADLFRAPAGPPPVLPR